MLFWEYFYWCAWWESNPRQTRFRKPPLYPTELQTHILFFVLKTAPLGKPARAAHRSATPFPSSPPRSLTLPRLAHCSPRGTELQTLTFSVEKVSKKTFHT